MNHTEIQHVRDQFIAAALIGLLQNANSIVSVSDSVQMAEDIADKVMARRKDFYDKQDKK